MSFADYSTSCQGIETMHMFKKGQVASAANQFYSLAA